jgi:glucose-1-phosphate thymidylyltransferase
MQNREEESHPEIIGLLPAGGKAARVSPLPCSKEIYPVGFRLMGKNSISRPKVVCHYLLENMRSAGVTKAFIILRRGKWDIPTYLRNGSILDMHLGYLLMEFPFGVPYTLDEAYPFVQDAIVVFGFPDIIFNPDDAFVQLLSRQSRSKADVVLGLFPAQQPQNVDMVDLAPDGRVRGIQIKPARTHLRHAWIIAVWTPVFTRFMHEYVSAGLKANNNDGIDHSIAKQSELFVGDVIQTAIHHDIQVDTVLFTNGKYLDVGIPKDMVKAVQIMNQGWEKFK